jgi:TPR repeat protein
MKRLLREAMAGDADAQFNLGVLYGNGLDDNGHPIASKPREAIKWLLAAAKQGLPQAQMRLAEAYTDKPTRSGGLAKAYFWFLLAGASLDGIHRERAQSGSDRILGELTPEEVTTAARLVQLWRPRRRPSILSPKPKPQALSGLRPKRIKT